MFPKLSLASVAIAISLITPARAFDQAQIEFVASFAASIVAANRCKGFALNLDEVTFVSSALGIKPEDWKSDHQDAPPGAAGNGKRLYLADGCFTCHGRSGQGGAFNGPAPSLAKTDMPSFLPPLIPRQCSRTRKSQICTPSCSRCRARVRRRTFRF